MPEANVPTHPSEGEAPIAVVGRYAIYEAIAAGGMATVHLGRLLGSAGFLRTVAIKRLHPQYAQNPDFTGMFLDEARLAARVQHPNVVPTLDVVIDGGELLLVMEYVRGVSLSQLTRAARDKGVRLPPRIVVAIMCGALLGLNAAHDATDERGEPLDLVHRDVSPQNVLVGIDGIARVLDFGIAKAAGRVHATKEGEIKGKLLYMPPEQLAAEPLTRRTDVYAAGLVLFEALTNVRMFAGEQEAAAIKRILANDLKLPSSIDPSLAPFDAVVRRAAAGDAVNRYATAAEMSRALEAVMPPATPPEVAEWVKSLGGGLLDERAKLLADVERSSTRSKPPPQPISERHPPVSAPGSMMNPVLLAAQITGGAPSSGSTPSAPAVSGSYATQTSPSRAGARPGPFQGTGAITTPSMVQTPPARSRMLIAVLVGALVALLAVTITAVGLLVVRAKAGPAPSASAEPSASVSVGVSVRTPESASASAPPPPLPPPTAAAAASTAPTTEAAPVKPAAVHVPVHSAATTKPTAAPKPKISCDPPYTVDKKGHRHFIPECVE